MLLHDSSGVDKDATLREHREALTAVMESEPPRERAREAAAAVDWLLFDWTMAHRDSDDSAAITVKDAPEALMIVSAAARSVHLRRLA